MASEKTLPKPEEFFVNYYAAGEHIRRYDYLPEAHNRVGVGGKTYRVRIEYLEEKPKP